MRVPADRFDFVVSVNLGAAAGGGFLGSGLLIDERHVLTCRHVVEDCAFDDRRSQFLLDDLEVGFHGATTRVRVEAIHDDPDPSLTDKVDLAVLALAAPHADVAPIRFLVGVGELEWRRLVPALRAARVLSSKGTLLLETAQLSPAFHREALSEIQITGHGAPNGFSGGAALCPIAQYWMCLGIPTLGGDRVGFTKLLSSDRAVVFLRRVGIPYTSDDAHELSQVAWAAASGRDERGRYADIELAGIRYRLRWIPPGSFLMQSAATHEQLQNVQLRSGFWLGETVCTRELWEAVSNQSRGAFPGADRPVVGVSWIDCSQFLARTEQLAPGLGMRLPTESEWEYACRANTTSPYSFGDTVIPDHANLRFSGPDGCRLDEPAPVRSYPSNEFGLYEMHGNVWEWCADWYGPYLGRTVIDPPGPMTGERRVARGGSWSTHPRTAQSGWREAFLPETPMASIGFRLARSAS